MDVPLNEWGWRLYICESRERARPIKLKSLIDVGAPMIPSTNQVNSWFHVHVVPSDLETRDIHVAGFGDEQFWYIQQSIHVMTNFVSKL